MEVERCRLLAQTRLRNLDLNPALTGDSLFVFAVKIEVPDNTVEAWNRKCKTYIHALTFFQLYVL